MKLELKIVFEKRIVNAKSLILANKLDEAFRELEIAHVLGQKYVVPHTISHLYMLRIGILKKDFKEVFGQLLRIPLGILGSLVGIVPTGNTGGSNVSAFKKMEISNEYKNLL